MLEFSAKEGRRRGKNIVLTVVNWRQLEGTEIEAAICAGSPLKY